MTHHAITAGQARRLSVVVYSSEFQPSAFCLLPYQCPASSHFSKPSPAPWELDQASEQLVATVVFPGRAANGFSLSVPTGCAIRWKPAAGCGVAVWTRRPNATRLLRAVGDTFRCAPAVEIGRRGGRFAGTIVVDHAAADPVDGRPLSVQLGRRIGSRAAGRGASQAGTRRVTLLSLAADAKEKMADGTYRKSNSKSSGFWPRIRNRLNPAIWPVPPTAHRADHGAATKRMLRPSPAHQFGIATSIDRRTAIAIRIERRSAGRTRRHPGSRCERRGMKRS